MIKKRDFPKNKQILNVTMKPYHKQKVYNPDSESPTSIPREPSGHEGTIQSERGGTGVRSLLP